MSSARAGNVSSYGAFNGVSVAAGAEPTSTVYGGTRPLKSHSIYRHVVRNNTAGGGAGSPFARHASFVIRSTRSDNLDNSDPEALSGGSGGTPVPYHSPYAAYGRSGLPPSYPPSSVGSHRSSGASLPLCRCGSGGPILPSSSAAAAAAAVAAASPPPALPSSALPPLSHALPPNSAYSRLVQSLPSTPNASRRPVSPMRPSFCQQQQQQQHHQQLQHQPSLHHPLATMDSNHIGAGGVATQQQQMQPPIHLKHLYGGATDHAGGATEHSNGPPPPGYGPVVGGSDCIGVGTSASGPSSAPYHQLGPGNSSVPPQPGSGSGGGPPPGSSPARSAAQRGMRIINNWSRGGSGGANPRLMRGNLTNRASLAPPTHRGTAPLMKLSTLVIVILAFLIIGFIVLSPLFHYLM